MDSTDNVYFSYYNEHDIEFMLLKINPSASSISSLFKIVESHGNVGGTTAITFGASTSELYISGYITD